ncbi:MULTISPECIES: type II toxin-antitoxin system HicB family antitoxin [Gordonibacter]|uniref:Type II toxin-antitoxin system HicB family antitoxin n=1 Tax=Gordonibacter faecis TaxID=3047475 RepID=A0ABT7DQE4_9ACTN|nr:MULTISPECIES: type II toxin-antitoxin system HicB family antitoxin [unclassified Gordonibacter]MDJ1651761.1 type II toxin-antitoxin system HicB family antitoxin [Gordonibacter sp. KGMB12511]HIW75704.1 type II toxin-antitoxin system HicB family antitoxin [Candidatus Gordonibacter avicola]
MNELPCSNNVSNAINTLTYKGYTALVSFDAEGEYLHGSVSGIRDVIYFEAHDAKEVSTAFHEAVDDYLEFCAAKGKQPDKPFNLNKAAAVDSTLGNE